MLNAIPSLFSAVQKTIPFALLVMGSYATAQAQTNPVTQTFGTTPSFDTNLQFTATNPATNTGVTPGYYAPTGAAGTGAYGIALANNGNGNGGSTQLEFAKTFPAGSGSAADRNRLSFDIASISNNGSTNQNGFGTTSSIDIYLSIAGAAYPATPQVRIAGSATQPLYGFNAGTVNPIFESTATSSYSNTSTNKVNSVTINLPNAPVNGSNVPTAGLRVTFRIVLTTFDRGTFLIDNVSLTAGNTTQPLPVELTRFDAAAKGSGVALSWATASEKNSAYFEVQRSATGEAYETIGKVAAQGSSTSLREYAYADSRPLVGRAYYRLRQVDADGSSAYSPVASVRADGLAEAQPYPNPSTDALTLPASLGAVQYRIFNPLGQMLLQGQAAGNERLDVRTLPKGPFFLELTNATGRHTQRLVKE